LYQNNFIMKKFLSVFLIGIRIYICFKFVGGLIMNTVNPNEYPLQNLDWLLYYLVFDIWIQLVIPNTISENTTEDVEQ
jgi:hypothetical protein